MLKLYWTPALPAHYVAEEESGAKWLIPVDPIGPEPWERRTEYRGNYTLQRVPDYVEKFYQPAEVSPCPTTAATNTA